MSYYRPSFAQTTGGMSRGGGRGGSFSSSRGSGSYRGGSNRGSGSWNSSNNRGYHNSRGGSSTAYRSSGGYSGGSFDTSKSMAKYGGERLTSFRGSSGGGDESYRRPSYRLDTGYPRVSRLSPERKRMRTESRHDVYSGSAGGGGGGGISDMSSSSRYTDSGEHRRSSMQDFGRSSKLPTSTPFGGSHHRPSSASGDFRKPLAPPPPPNIGSYSSSAPSGGRSGYHRGGRISSRSSRYIVSSRDTSRNNNSASMRPPPRRLMDYSTSTASAWRSSRGASSIRSSDYARRLRLRQLTNRSIIRSNRPIGSSRIKSRNDSDDELWGAVRDDDDDDEDEEDDEGEPEDDNENKNKDSAKDESAGKDANAEDSEGDKKTGDDSKEDKDDDEEEEDKGATATAEDGASKKDGEAAAEVAKKKPPTKKVSSSKVNKEREGSVEDPLAHRRQYIKLVCPYCHTRCITFSRYNMHLRSARHSAAMHHVALKQKSVLSRMRINQRSDQKEIERASDESKLTSRTNFCPLCKLNYRQAKVVHRASKAHRDMKRFLMPICKTCDITCKSPMLYETHCCSLDHIKRKAYATTNGDKSDKSDHSGDDLQNYMTIDSVGDMDDIDMEIPPPPSASASDNNDTETLTNLESSEVETKPTTTSSRGKTEKRSSSGSSVSNKREREPQINIGVENIRKIDVYYCNLCRMYLPRVEDVHDDLDRILAKHCKQRTHMQRYIRYKEDKDLAKRAERLQRREMAEKEKDAKRASKDTSKDDQTKSSSTNDQQKNNSTETTKTAAAAAANDSITSTSATIHNEEEESDSTNNPITTSALEDGDANMTDNDGNAAEEDKLLQGDEEVNVKEIQEADEAEAGDDKLWEDVDKDLGDILAGENKSCASDEEEEEDDDNSVANGERYDRFKYSEKNAKLAKKPMTAAANSKKAAVDAEGATATGPGVGEKSQVEGEAAK